MGSDHAAHNMHFLFFNDLQDLHRTNLGTDAAGDTLGRGAAFLQDHNLHGADLHTLTAGSAKLLIDHVHASLGVLSDCAGFTNLSTLTALDTDHGLCSAVLLDDLDAGQVLMELLIESSRASINTLQASHALCTLFYNKLLHSKESPLLIVLFYYTRTPTK